MNNKRTWLEKMSDFISGKGFYLVVLICVAAIALSGYYLVQGVRGGLDQTLDQPVSGSAAIVEPSAAPWTPMCSTKMKSGSKIRLITAPRRVVIIPVLPKPWALINGFMPKPIITGMIPAK